MRLGDSGPQVARYQELMKLIGFPLVVDGKFGRFTARATGDFQGMCTWVVPSTNLLLKVDGVAGPNTIAMAQRCLDNSRRISNHFAVPEFACNCRFPWPDADRMTIVGLELGRVHSGKPVIVLSGHRTDSHNIAVGGSAHSHHKCHPSGIERHEWCDTSAVDIGNWRQLRWTETVAREVMGITGGLGMDSRTGYVIHLDNGPFRRWFYT